MSNFESAGGVIKKLKLQEVTRIMDLFSGGLLTIYPLFFLVKVRIILKFDEQMLQVTIQLTLGLPHKLLFSKRSNYTN